MPQHQGDVVTPSGPTEVVEPSAPDRSGSAGTSDVNSSSPFLPAAPHDQEQPYIQVITSTTPVIEPVGPTRKYGIPRLASLPLRTRFRTWRGEHPLNRPAAREAIAIALSAIFVLVKPLVAQFSTALLLIPFSLLIAFENESPTSVKLYTMRFTGLIITGCLSLAWCYIPNGNGMGFSNGGWKRFVDWAVVSLGVYTVRALRSWKGEWWSRWTEVAIVGIIFGGFNDETVSPETDVGSYILPLVRFVCLIIAFIISVWVGVLCWPVRAAWRRRGEVADVVTQIADVLLCMGGNGDEWDIKVWTVMDRLKPGAKLKEIYDVVQAIRSLVYTLIFVHTSTFAPSSPLARSSPTSQVSDSLTSDTCTALSQCLDALASLLRRTINPGRPLGTAEVRAQFIVIEDSCRELQGHLERLSDVEDEQKQRLVVLTQQAFAVVEASRGLVCGD